MNTPAITLGQASCLPKRPATSAALAKRQRAFALAKAQAFFGADTEAAAITTERIEQWQDALLAEGRQPFVINRYVSALASALRRAHDHGLLDQMPQIRRSDALNQHLQASLKACRARVRARRAASAEAQG